MNREGGERRLNVAITRSRTEVARVLDAAPEQIDLARTRARGVQRPQAVPRLRRSRPVRDRRGDAVRPDRRLRLPFEKRGERPARRRRLAGPPAGGLLRLPDRSRRRRSRTAPGRYLLGIECDGANYHRAKTARDRDKLREGVLRGLGWSLHRIWSTDWWTNREREMEKMEAALGEREGRAERRTAWRECPPARLLPPPSPPPLPQLRPLAPRPPHSPSYEPYPGPRTPTHDRLLRQRRQPPDPRRDRGGGAEGRPPSASTSPRGAWPVCGALERMTSRVRDRITQLDSRRRACRARR